jgi:hypothetical protein
VCGSLPFENQENKMPFLMALAGVFWIYQMGLLNLEARLHEAPQAVASASDELDHYRAFLYLSDQYMRTHVPNPQSGPLRGRDLLAQFQQTGSMSADAFPQNWRLVVNAASEWITCTPMSEQALGMLTQWVTDPLLQLHQLHGSLDTAQQKNYWGVGQNLSAADVALCF